MTKLFSFYGTLKAEGVKHDTVQLVFQADPSVAEYVQEELADKIECHVFVEEVMADDNSATDAD